MVVCADSRYFLPYLSTGYFRYIRGARDLWLGLDPGLDFHVRDTLYNVCFMIYTGILIRVHFVLVISSVSTYC